ncbi:MAG: RNA methyltransferase [Candidatus Hydrogenedentes bacterium]|nr:RNA methyltransferase [Candidatus Hydrogenedentota bacterium]
MEPHYAKIPPDQLPPRPRNPVHVVLDNIRSAFNVGSIFRTADAGAVERIHLCGMTAYPPNNKLAKTALGAFDYVPWTYCREVITAIEVLRQQCIPIIAIETSPNAKSYADYPWPQPVAIVFGNEVRGIAPETLRQCDATVCIPMYGYKNTINVATTFGVSLFEILRHWGALDWTNRSPAYGRDLP